MFYVLILEKINNKNKSVSFDNKKTRIYTVLKILKVTSLYRYSDFIYVYLMSLSLEKINNKNKSVSFDNKKYPCLYGLKNIESDEYPKG